MKLYFSLTFFLSLLFSHFLFAQIPQAGLIAFYPFDGNGHDTSGNGYHAKLNGSYTLKTDEYPDRDGNLCALYFGNWTLKADFPVPTPNRSSISLWVKAQSKYTSFWNSYLICTTQHDTLVLHDPTGLPICNLKMKDSDWNHLVLTKPDSLSLGVYLNGNFQGNFSYHLPITYGTFYSNPCSYALDDIALYDRPLTVLEVGSLYNANSSCSKVVTGLEDVPTVLGTTIPFYPNPSRSGLFHVRGNEPYSLVTIEDVVGRRILPDENGEGVLDLSQQPRGIYMVRIVSQGQNRQVKLIVE